MTQENQIKNQPKELRKKATKKIAKPHHRYRGTRGVGQLLTKQLKNSTQKRGFHEGQIILKWHLIAPDFTSRALPTKLTYKNDLYLTVASASVQQEVTMAAPVLIDRINGFLGHNAVHQIRCKIGILPSPEHPKKPPITPTSKALEQAQKTCDTLEESPLKDALISLGSQIFNRKN